MKGTGPLPTRDRDLPGRHVVARDHAGGSASVFPPSGVGHVLGWDEVGAQVSEGQLDDALGVV
ncbi:hypothetical protein AB0O34_22795, partial [Sphaerisporangium sp. NPDC088356]|uniref:hypothetical protein n=1 Tax=Sphaerisporangium sp. NPDC088356 TaxID=3154871 RepID=UPI00341DAB0D